MGVAPSLLVLAMFEESISHLTVLPREVDLKKTRAKKLEISVAGLAPNVFGQTGHAEDVSLSSSIGTIDVASTMMTGECDHQRSPTAQVDLYIATDSMVRDDTAFRRL